MSTVPKVRITPLNTAPIRPEGEYVLYWMIANRRTTWNFSLDRAVEHAEELGKPLLIFEALRCGYRWASDRLHGFVIQGMVDNARRLGPTPVAYYPYVEPFHGAGQGLLAALADRACAVVTDDFPSFFLPRMVHAVADRLAVRFEMVDSNGLYPMRATDRVFKRAVDFRRHLQKTLAPHLPELPRADPLADASLPALDGLPLAVVDRWPTLDPQVVSGDSNALARLLDELPIDHDVHTVEARGGSVAAQGLLDRFLAQRLGRYEEGRMDLEQTSTSGFSPYLHFGHLSAHQIFHGVTESEDWQPGLLLGRDARGARRGWWGMDDAAEGFLDQLVTWRELGHNMSAHRQDLDTYASLPDWARATLAEHADDPRPHVYSLEEFETAHTHDEIWNAAQRELVVEGRMHNYLRMLWGKKILEWSATPAEALDTMIELNNKYALDGRNPNSYSGIFWCLGRYDRAWGPERPIFGKVRYMSSDSTRRKINLKGYLARYGPLAIASS